MRSRLLVAAILSAAFVGGGVLSAQPGATPSGGSPSTPTAGTPSAGAPAPTPAPAPAPTPAPTPPAPEPDLALPSEKTSNLSAQEMDQKSDELIENMEGLHRRVLELKASASKAKDVIKLNCVNEKLLVGQAAAQHRRRRQGQLHRGQGPGRPRRAGAPVRADHDRLREGQGSRQRGPGLHRRRAALRRQERRDRRRAGDPARPDHRRRRRRWRAARIRSRPPSRIPRTPARSRRSDEPTP
jgi:hypothetical protein